MIPALRVKMNKFLAECAKQGIQLVVTETDRTAQRQDALYAQGRTKPGKIVTYVTSKTGKHVQGKAFDVAFLINKRASYVGPWKKIGEIGVKCGLTWGGNFKGFYDGCHFEVA